MTAGSVREAKKDESFTLRALAKGDKAIAASRVLLASLLYYALLALSLLTMLLYRVLHLPATTEYICGVSVELECFSYVLEQLVETPQWQAVQFVVYMSISMVLWPIFKKARGKVLLNLGAVSLLVGSLLLLSIDNHGPELVAAVLGPLLVALLIIQRRKRNIVFNKS